MKAIVPVAGLGTRMLPATKAIPKEMLPIYDTPIIQHVVKEIADAGVTDIILVTHSSKTSIENHFDNSFELEYRLEERIKRSLLSEIQQITPPGVKITSIRQPGKRPGLGEAILQAEHLITDDFLIVLPDMILPNSPLNDMCEWDGNVLMTMLVDPEEVSNYGIVEREADTDSCIDIVEKPQKDYAPSREAIVGRYKLTPTVFDYIRRSPIIGGERDLTTALRMMVTEKERIDVFTIDSPVYDCGSKLGYAKAFIDYAMADPSVGAEIKRYITEFGE